MQRKNVEAIAWKQGIAPRTLQRFFWTLKHEWTKVESFVDIEDARLSVFRLIETYYNTNRIRQTLDFLSPNDFERTCELNLATETYFSTVRQ